MSGAGGDPEEVVDLQALGGDRAARAALGRRLLAALTTRGYASLGGHGLGELGEELLAAGRRFFRQPAAYKEALRLSRSPHFRGYSEMRNARDFREQLHFGPEEPARPPWGSAPSPAAGPSPAPRPCEQLRGPNLWPADDGPFREVLLRYLAAGGELGGRLLLALALALGLEEDAFGAQAAAERYLLLKLIRYHPQVDARPRPGVAPHCDWSLLTLLLEDAPGLEVRGSDGRWRAARAGNGIILLNAGELLEVLSGGAVPASPHRVVNASRRAPRLGVPLFVNPGLGDLVARRLPEVPRAADLEHVHRVLPPGPLPGPFRFGDSEWRRKGLGRWCHDPACGP